MRQIDRFGHSLGASPAALRAVAAVLALAVAACTTGMRPGTSALHAAPLLASRQSYVLSGDALHRRDTQTLLDVVIERWPGMARGELPRGAGLRLSDMPRVGDADRFGVYDLRGAFLGGPEYLANLRPADVQELRRLTEVEENARFGRRHDAGAILLTWARESQP